MRQASTLRIIRLSVLAVVFSLALSACQKSPLPPVKIAVNPWPGYAYLHLADELGLFAREGLNIRITPFDSLGDSLRAYQHGRVDGMASSIIESVQAYYSSNRPLKLVLIADYSNGADVIVAHKPIQHIADLQGRRVGVELGTLGVYILQRALELNGLRLDQVEVVNVEQGDALHAMRQGLINAYMTYPPVSTELVEQLGASVVFSSADIPYEVMDVVSIDAKILAAQPHLQAGIQRAWQAALEYSEQHPERAFEIMSLRTGISVQELQASLDKIEVLSGAMQASLFNAENRSLEPIAQKACQTLHYLNVLAQPCDNLSSMIY